ncbi:MAG: NAD(P)H-dependent oxidoreductase [Planctomycetaceae bacterium]|jgi:putative NADPH-quinone reductase|nr:NAD(P)H-dependent oxidoreductase [Planctomycetaceae bacterium]
MRVLIILANPNRDSFNHAIVEVAKGELLSLGHKVFFRDLYQEKFDPVLPSHENLLPESELPLFLQEYIGLVRSVDGLFFVHPNWWGGAPAILRGWIDRVLRQDSIYNFTPNGVTSKISNKIVQIISTSNTPKEIELNVYGDPVEFFWKTIVFGLLGVKLFERRNFESVIMSTQEQREEWLNETKEIVKRRFPSS